MTNMTKEELKKLADAMLYKDLTKVSTKSEKEKIAYNEGVMDLAESVANFLKV